jgi:ABC-type lipoprotein export system ATPase subunit
MTKAQWANMAPLLKISGLKKSYQSPEGEVQAVINIKSFELEAKKQVALKGESGGGKTTFLNLIAGLLAPDEGQIIINDVDLTIMSEARRDVWRAKNLGYIFQSFHLLQGYTALENVMLAMSFAGRSDRVFAEGLLKRVGLEHRLNYRPKQMSVGQQQRVAVARALANHPMLVLADEPTGNLDPVRAQESLAMVRDICSENGAALLIVSHDQNILDTFSEQLSLSKLNEATQEPVE